MSTACLAWHVYAQLVILRPMI